MLICVVYHSYKKVQRKTGLAEDLMLDCLLHLMTMKIDYNLLVYNSVFDFSSTANK